MTLKGETRYLPFWRSFIRNADRLIVMSRGHIVMQGSPKDIFVRKEELTEIGLSVPEITHILSDLKDEGYDVDTGIVSPDDAVAEILEKCFER